MDGQHFWLRITVLLKSAFPKLCTTIFWNNLFWSVLYLFSSFWTLFLEWKGCNSIYHFRSDGVPMRKVSPGNPSPLVERKNQSTQNLGRLTKMFTERFDEVIFEPLLLIDNLVYLFINLRAKRGGSLFETGLEREENGGVPSAQNVAVQKWRKARSQSDEIWTEGPSVQDAGTYSWVSRSCARSARNCLRSALKHSF